MGYYNYLVFYLELYKNLFFFLEEAGSTIHINTLKLSLSSTIVENKD
jgi:hypothetical protein